MTEEGQAPGWEAIDGALERLYGAQEPKHYGTLIPYAMGGSDPLDGISAYQAEEPVPHWHFVTYGFSELYQKESGDPEESGYGFELTFRLVRTQEEEEPPAWALNLLQNMGRYVFSSGNVFRAGDYMDANGPICLDSDTRLTALAFVRDPELPGIDTPNGRVEFLQMTGITQDELAAMQAWNTFGVLDAGAAHIPSYLTDLERHSLMEDKAVSDAVQDGLEREGSSTGFLFVDQLGWTPGKKGWLRKTAPVLTIGAKQADIIGKLLLGRIPKGRELTLAGAGHSVVFKRGEQALHMEDSQEVTIVLDDRSAREMAQNLVPQARRFDAPFKDGLTVEIVKTEITDQDGSVIRTIG
ncbi:suppressor of fused domain protein [Edaphobacillus lindanitolerans]|uniref:Suppressor of fused protein (SUFU) n=1 Tax=Edaphobacillus lindanitolerans TaxID=550447 RepID=A0A1U7PNP2_9BACI|nr:suppressor of fused domain protein [Edaphobacillus lindanitolerans]SIT87854.1 Suppressor of fused protein (SUFU) [Edaphobacillus lindanitolerans]